MGTTIGSGLGMLNAARGLNDTQRALSEAMKKLATGKRITGAATDPAGLAIAERMNSRILSLGAAAQGNETSANMLKVADQTLGAVSGLLGEARSLLVGANDATADGETRAALQGRLNQIIEGIDRLTGDAQFGSKKLFDGSLTITAATSPDGQSGGLTVEKTDSESLGLGATYKDEGGEEKPTVAFNNLGDLKTAVTSGGDLDQAAAVLDKAMSQVGEMRERFGALESDLIKPLGEAFSAAYTELQSAASTVSDTDYALETARVTGENLRSQVKMALIAQGKDNSQSLFQLLM